jgi:hypothetical protein
LSTYHTTHFNTELATYPYANSSSELPTIAPAFSHTFNSTNKQPISFIDQPANNSTKLPSIYSTIDASISDSHMSTYVPSDNSTEHEANSTTNFKSIRPTFTATNISTFIASKQLANARANSASICAANTLPIPTIWSTISATDITTVHSA